MKKSPLVWLAVAVGIIFLIIGYIYATHTADTLPHWLPGYDLTMTKVHTKHALGAIVLAVASFVFAWFQTGPKATAPSA
jgi:hypothetical protein